MEVSIVNSGFPRHRQGVVSRQAQGRWPEGTIEEHHGRDGFTGDCSQLYRRHATTDWLRVEGPIRPRGLRCDDLAPEDLDSPRALPIPLLSNTDVRVSVSKRAKATPFIYRNADADIAYVIQRGSGALVSDYGELRYGPLEYVLVPKGTNHRLMPDTADNLMYVIETTAPLRLPDRVALGHFLPFDVGVLDVPTLSGQRDVRPHNGAGGEWEIVVKRNDECSSIFYDFDPFDTVGWQGTVAPRRLGIADIRPLTSERLDVPPITHATFTADGVWICTFCPRPWQRADEAEPVQPFHRNVDCDEVFITLGAEHEVRGRPPGSLTFTPAGMDHGPGVGHRIEPIERFQLYLLNIDTSRPLTVEPAFEANEIPEFFDRQRYSGPTRPATN
jgi:homogentisate 1,2-dioxygenase